MHRKVYAILEYVRLVSYLCRKRYCQQVGLIVFCSTSREYCIQIKLLLTRESRFFHLFFFFKRSASFTSIIYYVLASDFRHIWSHEPLPILLLLPFWQQLTVHCSVHLVPAVALRVMSGLSFQLPDMLPQTRTTCTRAVAVLRWGQGAQAPQILPRTPRFLDTVVLLLVELIGSIVNFA